MYLIFIEPRLKRHEMSVIKDNIFKCFYRVLKYIKGSPGSEFSFQRIQNCMLRFTVMLIRQDAQILEDL